MKRHSHCMMAFSNLGSFQPMAPAITSGNNASSRGKPYLEQRHYFYSDTIDPNQSHSPTLLQGKLEMNSSCVPRKEGRE